jgi:hypothetical protein
MFSSLLLSTSLLAQERLKPSKTETLATFTFLQPNNQPFANSVILFRGNKGSKISATTNASGLLKTLLPNNETFTTISGVYLNDRLIKTGNKAYSAIGGKRYTHRFIEYSFYYKNKNGDGAKGELVTIVSNTGKTYTQTTTADGFALFYLPIQEKYTVNLTHHPNAKTIDIPDSGHSYLQFSSSFRGMSSIEKEQSGIREVERAKELVKKRAQAKAQAKIDEEVAEEKRVKDTAQKEKNEKSISVGMSTRIVFFASQSKFKGVGVITVYDGGKNGAVIGKVRSIWSCTRGPIKEDDFEAQVVKRKGTYTYYAKSAEGVEWEGSYEVLGGGRKNIPLKIKDK